MISRMRWRLVIFSSSRRSSNTVFSRSVAISVQKACIHIVLLFHTPVVASGALFPEGPGGGDGAVANDGLVVVLNDHIVPGVQPDVRSVDFPSGVFIHFWNEIRSSTRGQCMCCCRLRSMSPEGRESRLCPSAQRPYPAA